MSTSATSRGAWTVRPLPVPDRWCVHGYYTLCPWAPDGSNRLLIAGADLDRNIAQVLVLDEAGQVLDRFGRNPPLPSFWHTGFWQSWSPDARFVYYQAGTLREPRVVRRELSSGREIELEGDLEGIPPSGEPGISGSHGLLYAAGYGDNQWKPHLAPVPFAARDQHGIYRISFDPPRYELALSTAQILAMHPRRAAIEQLDDDVRRRLGPGEGLTLMAYCVRWNRQGTRMLFYFGNHSVSSAVPQRGEPQIRSIFTADREFKDIHLALDMGSEGGGHWSWHPDGEHLLGNARDPARGGATCVAMVKYDGTGYRRIMADGGGHPSVSPRDHHLGVRDVTSVPGSLRFYDLHDDRLVQEIGPIANTFGPGPFGGSLRQPNRVCLHPVFNHAGDKLLINTIPGRLAVPAVVDVPEVER